MLLVSDPNIHSVDTPNGRYYHNTETDQKLWSVTTVLGRYFKKNNDGGLELWKNRVGLEEAEGIKIQAGRRGSALHDIAEKYILGQDWKKGQMPINLMTFQKFKKVLDAQCTLPLGTEFILWDPGRTTGAERRALGSEQVSDQRSSPMDGLALNPNTNGMDSWGSSGVLPEQLRNSGERLVVSSAAEGGFATAGRLDLLADYDGVRSIIDFKTARKRKRVEHITGYFYQTEVYGQIVNRLLGTQVQHTVILIANDEDPLPQIFITELGRYKSEVEAIFGDPAYNGSCS